MSTGHKFLDETTNLIPNFDGKFENLQDYLDALSFVDSIKGTHEDLAVKLIKVKLARNVRNLVTTESTVQEIINTLMEKIKGESIDTLPTVKKSKAESKTSRCSVPVDEAGKY